MWRVLYVELIYFFTLFNRERGRLHYPMTAIWNEGACGQGLHPSDEAFIVLTATVATLLVAHNHLLLLEREEEV